MHFYEGLKHFLMTVFVILLQSQLESAYSQLLQNGYSDHVWLSMVFLFLIKQIM